MRRALLARTEAAIDGRQIFYREAGAADAPVIVLLHGFPASSFMFRSLIPQLADRFHVIAPDYLGFGYSDAPAVEEFDYTFDALAKLTAGLLDHLGVSRYSLFVQDYGAPVGWRLALRDPQAVTAIITQNGNGYDEGFVTEAWQLVWDYQREQTPQTTAAATDFLSFEATRFQYTAGAPDASVVSPDTWHHEFGLLSRPGNTEIQLKLFLDYAQQPAHVPGTARIPASQCGSGVGDLGRQEPVLRTRRRPCVRQGRGRARDPPARRRSLPA